MIITGVNKAALLVHLLRVGKHKNLQRKLFGCKSPRGNGCHTQARSINKGVDALISSLSPSNLVSYWLDPKRSPTARCRLPSMAQDTLGKERAKDIPHGLYSYLTTQVCTVAMGKDACLLIT
jgi:hypothetical protein